MKIGIFTALFHDRPIEEALDIIAEAGIEAVELGAGAYPGSRHLDDVGGIQKLISDDGARKKLLKLVESRGLFIDSLSVHGNPLHPNKNIANEHHLAFENAVLLAEKLGLTVVNGFSGRTSTNTSGRRRAASCSSIGCSMPKVITAAPSTFRSSIRRTHSSTRFGS